MANTSGISLHRRPELDETRDAAKEFMVREKIRAEKKKPVRVPAKDTEYFMRLFVAGDERNSILAKENLQMICKNHLGGRYEIEVIDVKEDFGSALESNVFVTPMLILVSPPPGVKILGNLSDTQKLLRALGIEEVKG